MTATPPDPLATQHDGTPDPEHEAPVDSQTLRLREENRALRELLAAQVQASLPRQEPGWFKRLCWWLISAPGAALMGWRRLLGGDATEPMTRRRVGFAALTVLYTLAIYGALVLLVVSWNSPNTANSGVTAASPVRVPLTPPPLPPESDAAGKAATAPSELAETEDASGSTPSTAEAPPSASIAPEPPSIDSHPVWPVPSNAAEAATNAAPPQPSAGPAPTAPQPTLRITEIPAPDPMAWVGALDSELARCAELGFFERPDCAWEARKQYCEPNNGWGKVKECPAQP